MIEELFSPLGKIRLVLEAVAVLAIAALVVWGNSIKVDLDAEKLVVSARDATIVKANTQNTELNGALVVANRELALSRLQMAAAEAAVDHAAGVIRDLGGALQDAQRRLNDAPKEDDGPAAAVLIFAANGLQSYGQAFTALRARYDHQDGARGNAPPPGAAADPWPQLKPGFTQRQFAAVTLQLAGWLKDAAGNLAGIIDYQAGYNANVQQFNAAGAAP